MKVKPPATYQGGKQRLAAQILDIIKPTAEGFADLCCGSGALAIEARSRGIPAAAVTMVDCGPWGIVWEEVAEGRFDLVRLRRIADAVPTEVAKQADFIRELLRQPASIDTAASRIWWTVIGRAARTVRGVVSSTTRQLLRHTSVSSPGAPTTHDTAKALRSIRRAATSSALASEPMALRSCAMSSFAFAAAARCASPCESTNFWRFSAAVDWIWSSCAAFRARSSGDGIDAKADMRLPSAEPIGVWNELGMR